MLTTFANIKEGQKFKSLKVVAKKVLPGCPEYTRIKPFLYAGKHPCNAEYCRPISKVYAFVNFKDIDQVEIAE